MFAPEAVSGGVDSFSGMAENTSHIRGAGPGVRGSFDHVDPAALVIGANVRDELHLEEDFVDSVCQCRFRSPLANRYRRELNLLYFSALLGEAVFPLFVANPRTVRLYSYSPPVRNGFGRFTSRQPNQIPWPLRRR
jgi:hypothetical protein